MHTVSTLKYYHMWVIFKKKKEKSPKLISITVASSRMQTVSIGMAWRHIVTKSPRLPFVLMFKFCKGANKNQCQQLPGSLCLALPTCTCGPQSWQPVCFYLSVDTLPRLDTCRALNTPPAATAIPALAQQRVKYGCSHFPLTPSLS